jgi:serine acetyltransferase
MIATDPSPLDLNLSSEVDLSPSLAPSPERDRNFATKTERELAAERRRSSEGRADAPPLASGEAAPASGTTAIPAKVSAAALAAVVERKPSMLECLRADAARYGEFGGGHWYSELGFWITATHRYGAWCWSLPFILRLFLGMPFRIINRFWRFFLHVNISVKAEIGPGLCLIHPTSIMIPSTKIGSNVLIFHEVTIGANLTRQGHPTIGNNVDVYVGARILGGIKIGDNSKIGANCVVTSNVAPNSIVFSAPTRTLQGRA